MARGIGENYVVGEFFIDEATCKRYSPYPVTWTLTDSPECVRSVYITRSEPAPFGPPQVDLVIGIDGANHMAVFGQGQSVADAVQRLRDLANELERGALRRMENQQ